MSSRYDWRSAERPGLDVFFELTERYRRLCDIKKLLMLEEISLLDELDIRQRELPQ